MSGQTQNLSREIETKIETNENSRTKNSDIWNKDFTNGVKSILERDIIWIRNTIDLYLTPNIEIDLRWIINLKAKATEYLEENRRASLLPGNTESNNHERKNLIDLKLKILLIKRHHH